MNKFFPYRKANHVGVTMQIGGDIGRNIMITALEQAGFKGKIDNHVTLVIDQVVMHWTDWTLHIGDQYWDNETRKVVDLAPWRRSETSEEPEDSGMISRKDLDHGSTLDPLIQQVLEEEVM